MGQLANHLSERDKGKLPSQVVNNPKACSIGNSSNHEHVQVIVTLRSGKRVDNEINKESFICPMILLCKDDIVG
jgi:hypothetical protein